MLKPASALAFRVQPLASPIWVILGAKQNHKPCPAQSKRRRGVTPAPVCGQVKVNAKVLVTALKARAKPTVDAIDMFSKQENRKAKAAIAWSDCLTMRI